MPLVYAINGTVINIIIRSEKPKSCFKFTI